MSLDNCRLMLSRQNRYEFSFASIIGTRKTQEDYFGIISSENAIAACVCDGMGGLEYGAQASEMSINVFFDQITPNIDNCADATKEFYTSMLDKMDHNVHLIKRPDGTRASAGSTIISVFISNYTMKWLSVGDSSIFLLRDGDITQMNTFHNYQTKLNEKYLAGQIDRDYFVKESRKGHALISYIGVGELKLIDISKTTVDVQKNDVVLLCSDGITGYISPENINKAIMGKSAKKAVDLLMNQLVQTSQGKPLDNATVILIRIK